MNRDNARPDSIVEWWQVFHHSEVEQQLAMLGERDGAQWADHLATKAELRRLAQARHPQDDWSFAVGISAYSDAERFYFLIHPEFDGDRVAAAEFWEIEVTGERETPEPAYVQAFAEGAMAASAERNI